MSSLMPPVVSGMGLKVGSSLSVRGGNPGDRRIPGDCVPSSKSAGSLWVFCCWEPDDELDDDECDTVRGIVGGGLIGLGRGFGVVFDLSAH